MEFVEHICSRAGTQVIISTFNSISAQLPRGKNLPTVDLLESTTLSVCSIRTYRTQAYIFPFHPMLHWMLVNVAERLRHGGNILCPCAEDDSPPALLTAAYPIACHPKQSVNSLITLPSVTSPSFSITRPPSQMETRPVAAYRSGMNPTLPPFPSPPAIRVEFSRSDDQTHGQLVGIVWHFNHVSGK